MISRRPVAALIAKIVIFYKNRVKSLFFSKMGNYSSFRQKSLKSPEIALNGPGYHDWPRRMVSYSRRQFPFRIFRSIHPRRRRGR